MILTGGLGVGGPLVTGGLGLGPGAGVAPQPEVPDYFPTGGVPLRRLRPKAKTDRADLWVWRLTNVGGIASQARLGMPTVRLLPLEPAQDPGAQAAAQIAAEREAQAFARRVARRRREEELLLLLH